LMLVLLIAWLAIKSFVENKNWMFATANPFGGGSILPMLCGAALGFGMSAPAWLAIFDYVYGSARGLQSAGAHWQWIVPWRALPGFILPCWTVNWADFSTRSVPHTGIELACGLAAPAALVAGFLWRPRMLMRRLRWELILLALLLLLCMIPTAGVFRWSFRWLPFLHLVLALCAAQVLQLRPRLATGAACFLLLIAVTIPMSILNLGGSYAPTVTWIYFEIAAVWALFELFLPIAGGRKWAPPVVTFVILLATYFCIPPNCGVPKYNFSEKLTKPEPLDQERLYLAVYSPAEYAYRREYRNGPVGQVARPGSTPMWAQLRFINGYSPILAAGVARELKFFTHGEIDGDIGRYLVTNQAGHGGLLDQLGVDGLVIAREISVEPPSDLWREEFSNDEGRVFHRAGEPFPTVRSVEWIDSLPEKEFTAASLLRIDDTRNHVEVDVDVPPGSSSALLTFSRPYFRGYQAKIENQNLRVDSYRGLFPIVEVPRGSHGRLVLTYRPLWLTAGVTLSILSALIWAVGLFAAVRTRFV
jgi:hypothetical protein